MVEARPKVVFIEQCALLCVPCLSIYRHFAQAHVHLWGRRSCGWPAGSILACINCSLQCHTGGEWIYEVSQRWVVEFTLATCGVAQCFCLSSAARWGGTDVLPILCGRNGLFCSALLHKGARKWRVLSCLECNSTHATSASMECCGVLGVDSLMAMKKGNWSCSEADSSVHSDCMNTTIFSYGFCAAFATLPATACDRL